MSELQTKLNIGNQQISFYTTIEEASRFGDYGPVIVNGTQAYYGLGLGDSANTGSDYKSTLRVIKNNTTYYMMTQSVELNNTAVSIYNNNNTEVISIYNDATLNDLNNVSFEDSDNYNVIYIEKKLNVPTSLLNEADAIIIPADEDLYNSILEDNYWSNYINKISFVQQDISDNNSYTLGKDLTLKAFNNIGSNLATNNNTIYISPNVNETSTITPVDETTNSTTYKKYVIPNNAIDVII